jgi:hypothetical protein
MPIDPLLTEAAFDPETTAILAAAFDTAWETVKRSGSAAATDADVQSRREQLAKHIIAAARDGERDPHRLVERALSDLALYSRKPPSSGAGGPPA